MLVPKPGEEGDADYGYSFTDIRTEWDQITDLEIARGMVMQYQMMALPVMRLVLHQIQRHQKGRVCDQIERKRAVKKSGAHVVSRQRRSQRSQAFRT